MRNQKTIYAALAGLSAVTGILCLLFSFLRHGVFSIAVPTGLICAAACWLAVKLYKTLSLLEAMERMPAKEAACILKRHQKDPFLCSIGAIIAKQNLESTRQQEVELLKHRSHLQELQGQINPHFLYNTLESIRGEALSENSPHIAEMTKRLSSLFRYSISTHRELVSFREELDNVQNYMAIQKFRFRDKLSLDVVIEDEACLDYQVIKLTLQPFVENSIYHGLETISRKGRITIRAVCTQKKLLITVSDNGKGIEPDRLRTINDMLLDPFSVSGSELSSAGSFTGIALVNICKRIKLRFGDDYGFVIQSIPELGTDISISLPAVMAAEQGTNSV